MSLCSFTCSNLLCEVFSSELPGLRIYFAIYVQGFLHQAICIRHRKGGVYIHEISEELSININFIVEMLLLLWLYNLSLKWPGSCPQPEKVSEDSKLAREAWDHYCPSTNYICLSPKAEIPKFADVSIWVQHRWLHYGNLFHRAKREEGCKECKQQGWEQIVGSVCLTVAVEAQNEAFSAFLGIHHAKLHSDQVFPLALPLVPLDMPSLSVQQLFPRSPTIHCLPACPVIWSKYTSWGGGKFRSVSSKLWSLSNVGSQEKNLL